MGRTVLYLYIVTVFSWRLWRARVGNESTCLKKVNYSTSDSNNWRLAPDPSSSFLLDMHHQGFNAGGWFCFCPSFPFSKISD